MTFQTLRPKRTVKGRGTVAHIFEDLDSWFPWRMTLCGREIEGDRLTDENIDQYRTCQHCLSHVKEVKV